MNSHEAVAKFNMVAQILGLSPLKMNSTHGFDRAIAELRLIADMIEAQLKIVAVENKQLKSRLKEDEGKIENTTMRLKIENILQEKHWTPYLLSQRLGLSPTSGMITLWLNRKRNITAKHWAAIDKIWETRGIE